MSNKLTLQKDDILDKVSYWLLLQLYKYGAEKIELFLITLNGSRYNVAGLSFPVEKIVLFKPVGKG
jgi:hypothetical protein